MQAHTPPFLLRELKIEVTYACDLNCLHCSSDAHPSNPLEMSLPDSLRILKQASEIGVKELAFSGGEPLRWPYLCEAVSFAVQHDLRVTVYTSGNSDDFTSKASLVKHAGAYRLIVSLFGAKRETHERITRIIGSFEKTTEALRVAKALGFATEIHFVPMTTNYFELPEVAALGNQLGASAVSVLRLVPQGRGALLRSRILSRVQNLGLQQTVRTLRKAGHTIRAGSPYNFLLINEKPGCWAAIDRLIIGPDMKVYPCDAFKRIDSQSLVGTDNLSNLKDTSLDACWQKSPYLTAIREYLTTEFKDPCASCTLLKRCFSGCLAQKTIAEGELKKRPDPDCIIN